MPEFVFFCVQTILVGEEKYEKNIERDLEESIEKNKMEEYKNESV